MTYLRNIDTLDHAKRQNQPSKTQQSLRRSSSYLYFVSFSNTMVIVSMVRCCLLVVLVLYCTTGVPAVAEQSSTPKCCRDHEQEPAQQEDQNITVQSTSTGLIPLWEVEYATGSIIMAPSTTDERGDGQAAAGGQQQQQQQQRWLFPLPFSKERRQQRNQERLQFEQDSQTIQDEIIQSLPLLLLAKQQHQKQDVRSAFPWKCHCHVSSTRRQRRRRRRRRRNEDNGGSSASTSGTVVCQIAVQTEGDDQYYGVLLNPEFFTEIMFHEGQLERFFQNDVPEKYKYHHHQESTTASRNLSSTGGTSAATIDFVALRTMKIKPKVKSYTYRYDIELLLNDTMPIPSPWPRQKNRRRQQQQEEEEPPTTIDRRGAGLGAAVEEEEQESSQMNKNYLDILQCFMDIRFELDTSVRRHLKEEWNWSILGSEGGFSSKKRGGWGGHNIKSNNSRSYYNRVELDASPFSSNKYTLPKSRKEFQRAVQDILSEEAQKYDWFRVAGFPSKK